MSSLNLPTEKELKEIRKKAVEMVYRAGGGHLGAAFSCAEIAAVLYKNILRVKPSDPHFADRDRLIFSKGHSCLTPYILLAGMGFFPKEELELFCKIGGSLPGHTTIVTPGIEASTGSLGHGLSIGVGMAQAAKIDNKKWRVFVILGDGDCEEGSTWEAVMSAGHHQLDNLIAVVDFNNLSSFEKATETFHNFLPLASKFKSFGWSTEEVDGHNVKQLYKVFKKVPFTANKPSVIIANTIKGKGVSFMENNYLWHYKVPTEEEYQKAVAELAV